MKLLFALAFATILVVRQIVVQNALRILSVLAIEHVSTKDARIRAVEHVHRIQHALSIIIDQIADVWTITKAIHSLRVHRFRVSAPIWQIQEIS